eukprot:CAMPEP_0115012572 /NCGR_PEP_ID=MMETSP0216-20121206/24830_1 /TAXON_ID=223996 /ORGANISM="Protocruzia adherens, Strain Boccale" /LENGTH=526 /DNA_ID=CAMNT_0002381681 /DNA_START=46 /DNA_END=1626 /DNA_ORIENTATION=+
MSGSATELGLSEEGLRIINNDPAMKRMQLIADRLYSENPELAAGGDALTGGKKGTKGDRGKDGRKKNVQPAVGKSHQFADEKIKTQEWQTKCEEISHTIRHEQELKQKLLYEMQRRQERYIKREQEYRLAIEELQRELKFKGKDEYTEKNLDEIVSLHNKIMENIDNVQHKTANILQEQQKDIVRSFNAKLTEYKNELEKEKAQKANLDFEPLDKENKLTHQLEWMKNIAQKMEKENQMLAKKNGELKFEFKTQENDREIRIRQLIESKKENERLRKELHKYKKLERERDDIEKSMKTTEGNITQSSFSSFTKMNVQKSMGEFPSRNATASRASSSRPMSGVSTGSRYRGNHKANRSTGGFGVGVPSFAGAYRTTGGMRPGSMNFQDKVSRYETLIEKEKMKLENLKRSVRSVKDQHSKEIQNRTELEYILRKTVDEVRIDILKRQHSDRNIGEIVINRENLNNVELTHGDRERVIESLLSQERVLQLLYDNTFPSNELDQDDGVPIDDTKTESDDDISNEIERDP